MNDNHLSNADVSVPEKPKETAKDKVKDAGKDAVLNEDHADDEVERETEDMFRDAGGLPEEDSA
jgi:vacuolar-type H+-ATPase subunit H